MQDLIYAGKLDHVRVGRKVRVPESTLVDFIASLDLGPEGPGLEMATSERTELGPTCASGGRRSLEDLVIYADSNFH